MSLLTTLLLTDAVEKGGPGSGIKGHTSSKETSTANRASAEANRFKDSNDHNAAMKAHDAAVQAHLAAESAAKNRGDSNSAAQHFKQALVHNDARIAHLQHVMSARVVNSHPAESRRRPK